MIDCLRVHVWRPTTHNEEAPRPAERRIDQRKPTLRFRHGSVRRPDRQVIRPNRLSASRPLAPSAQPAPCSQCAIDARTSGSAAVGAAAGGALVKGGGLSRARSWRHSGASINRIMARYMRPRPARLTRRILLPDRASSGVVLLRCSLVPSCRSRREEAAQSKNIARACGRFRKSLGAAWCSAIDQSIHICGHDRHGRRGNVRICW